MRGFQVAIVVCAFVGLSIAVSGSPTYAADPNVIFGQWVQKFPNGNAMVTDFEPNSMESYNVDANGKRGTNVGRGKYQVTYKNLGQSNIGVNFSDGGTVFVIIKDKDTIILDFPGLGAHVLKRLNSHPSAESLSPIIQLFLDACVPNMGKLDGVRAYAAAHNLTVITDKTLLGAFVGPGPHGAAWLVPSTPPQHYALSIRGTTQACAVWAAQADPHATETQFTKIIEGMARPALAVKEDAEKAQPSKFGIVKAINYHAFSPTSGQGFEFTLITAEHPGGPFQANIQVSPVAPH